MPPSVIPTPDVRPGARPAARRRRPPVALALALTAVVVAPGAAGAASAERPARAAAPAPAAAAVPALGWGACPEGWTRDGVDPTAFDCAVAAVPLDHDDPTGPTIDLAVKRLPASGDPAERIGTLFLNPGGPGGSGVGFVDSAEGAFPAEVLERFDVVGFDPRGVARSTPLACFPDLDTAVETLFDLPPFPVGTREQLRHFAAYRTYTDFCAGQVDEQPVIEHMSTADVARDLDLLRQAVGDEALTYAGYSYGTHLGDVYANLFPDRVRALVLDAVIEPVAWTTGESRRQALTETTSHRLRTGEGAYGTLQALLAECAAAGPEACALAAGGDPSGDYDRLAAALLDEPLVVVDAEGGETRWTYADLVSTSLGALYDAGSYPALADLVAALLVLVDAREDGVAPDAATTARAAAAGERLATAADEPEPAEERVQISEGTDGVLCTDGDNPRRQRAWRTSAAAADAQGPYFGSAWVWSELACATWPVRADSRYTGPWDEETAAPVLVVGTRYDPATPYRDAVTVSEQLPGARLLTLEGWGHTALGASGCIDDAVARYLVDQQLPAEGTVCAADRRPFDPPPVSALRSAGPSGQAAKDDVVAALRGATTR